MATLFHWEFAAAMPHPWKTAMWAGLFVVSVSYLVWEVMVRRKKGQSWNESLANGEKLITGNVWLDGLLFAGVLLVMSGIVWFVAVKT